MKFWVGVTDNGWFKHLTNLSPKPDEVNFWQPGGKNVFQAVPPAGPFLFKLHSPDNFIVGGGFFVKHSFLPLSLAWEAFGEKNGVPDYATFLRKILRYRQGELHGSEPTIGCIVLSDPFFLERDAWIPIPADWKSNIVTGKRYDTADHEGDLLWQAVSAKLPFSGAVGENLRGNPYLVHPRLGQGAFRVLVTESYDRRCAITGEKTLPALEAAHIRPFKDQGPHRVDNGLLLRADLHKLFDKGYMTITPDLHVEVSRKIKEDFQNGREYYPFHGRELFVIPKNHVDRPSRDFIDWHNQHSFKA